MPKVMLGLRVLRELRVLRGPLQEHKVLKVFRELRGLKEHKEHLRGLKVMSEPRGLKVPRVHKVQIRELRVHKVLRER